MVSIDGGIDNQHLQMKKFLRLHLRLLFLCFAIPVPAFAQSIFNVTWAPATSSPTVAPTGSQSEVATNIPTSTVSTGDGNNDDDEILQITFSYKLITRVTEDLPEIENVTALVDSELSRLLENLTTSEISGQRVTLNSVSQARSEACQTFDEAQFALFDRCHEVQTTVILTVDSTISPTVVQFVIIEEVQRFAESFNGNQTDILILFQSPKYVSTNLNIVLVAVSGAMNEEERRFFEQLLFIALDSHLKSSPLDEFTLVTAQVLTQSPYNPNANNTRRSLQIGSNIINATGVDLTNIDPNTIPFNDLQVFIQATCDDIGCNEQTLKEALYLNASSYLTDLALAIEVNRQLLLSQYFDLLFDVLVARAPQLSDIPDYDPLLATDDALELLTTNATPNWVWALCGVNVGIILITAGWIVVQSLRRETRERDDLEKIQNMYNWR